MDNREKANIVNDAFYRGKISLEVIKSIIKKNEHRGVWCSGFAGSVWPGNRDLIDDGSVTNCSYGRFLNKLTLVEKVRVSGEYYPDYSQTIPDTCVDCPVFAIALEELYLKISQNVG